MKQLLTLLLATITAKAIIKDLKNNNPEILYDYYVNLSDPVKAGYCSYREEYKLNIAQPPYTLVWQMNGILLCPVLYKLMRDTPREAAGEDTHSGGKRI